MIFYVYRCFYLFFLKLRVGPPYALSTARIFPACGYAFVKNVHPIIAESSANMPFAFSSP